MIASNSFEFNSNEIICTSFGFLVIYWFYSFWRNETIILDVENKIFNKNHLEINSEETENKYPNTWYPIIQSKNLKPGEVKPIYALEKDLVVYRTFSGKVCVLDAYCPHQGTHLGVGGSVVGEDIRCPFHCWTFNGDGACTSVPGLGDSNLPKVKVKSWKCIEMNHFVFLWFHNKGLEPDWMPQRYSELEQAHYCGEIQAISYCHIKDFHGNSFDHAHLSSLHTLGGIVSTKQLLTKGKIFNLVNSFFRFDWVFVSEEIQDENVFNKTKEVVVSITPVLFDISFDFLKTVSTITVCLPMVYITAEMPWFKAKHYLTGSFVPISYLKWRHFEVFHYKRFSILSRLYAKIAIKYVSLNLYPEFIVLANLKHLTHPHLTSLDKKQAKYYRWADRFYL